jgi:CheY-like chemotaxis protein
MNTPKYKILLVEDAQIAQKMASVILRNIGCEVHAVKNGKEAVNLVAQEHYDLIFMDLGLPDIDGFSTTETIRNAESKSHPDQRIPIIALTTHEGEHVKVTCLDTRMDDFLIKPLTEETALEMLKKHLRR